MVQTRRSGMSDASAINALRIWLPPASAQALDPCCRVCSELDPCDCDDGGAFEGSWDANGSPVEAA
jgi:hypothetical protein